MAEEEHQLAAQIEAEEDEGSSGSLEEDGSLNEEGEEHDDSQRAVSSSMVQAWGYQRETEEIEISFTSGHTMSYPCPPDLWEEAKNAVSPGRFVHEHFL